MDRSQLNILKFGCVMGRAQLKHIESAAGCISAISAIEGAERPAAHQGWPQEPHAAAGRRRDGSQRAGGDGPAGAPDCGSGHAAAGEHWTQGSELRVYGSGFYTWVGSRDLGLGWVLPPSVTALGTGYGGLGFRVRFTNPTPSSVRA